MDFDTQIRSRSRVACRHAALAAGRHGGRAYMPTLRDGMPHRLPILLGGQKGGQAESVG
jgi:hypothetical protein